MSVATGTVAVTETPEVITRLNRYTAWERIITFSIVDNDTTGAAVVPINGLLQKIIVTLSDMDDAEGTTDVSLTDNGDNTIFSVTNLAESNTTTYIVSEPLVGEVNVILGHDDPNGPATVVVTLRGV
ncbi:hypothetical protein LCGC14_1014880 [marine sediment metagenome]|uniref:Uncharacterized protein n=1 Tax=marine sediment metagenome TaxID=412755 RepID=A0A0F9NKP5_9ZZZZ|nr:hypothetical protein [Pricia sp.]